MNHKFIKRFIIGFLSLVLDLCNDTRAVAFDIWSIVFMMLAIWLGTFIGSGIAVFLGFAGGIIGSLIVGAIIYVVYCFATGRKIVLWAGVIFAVLMWIAQILAGMVSGATGLGGGLIGLLITAVIMSFLWGNFGTKWSGTKGSRRRR